MSNNYVVAFLDLLGFSSLLKEAPEIAFDNMNTFHHVLRTRYMDDMAYPREEYEKNSASNDSLGFVDEHSVSSFKQVITFSDSLVIGSDDLDLFVRQLGNFVANIYIRYSSQFAKMPLDIGNITDIRSDLLANYKNGKIEYNKSFPVLFRGGVAMGNEVGFWDEICVRDGKMDFAARDVGGRTYLEAVILEKYSAGPRLFCHKELMDACEYKDLFEQVDDFRENQSANIEKSDTYEILWPILGCQCGERSSDAKRNIYRAVEETMLPPAVKLYKYYEAHNDLKDQVRHYKALLILVVKGIMRYGEIKQAGDYTSGLISDYFDKHDLSAIF